MRFYTLDELRKDICGIMERLHTNLAVVTLREVREEKYHIVEEQKYKMFVTRDKHTNDLNFFDTYGVHMSWLSILDILPPQITYIDLISLTDILEVRILDY